MAPTKGTKQSKTEENKKEKKSLQFFKVFIPKTCTDKMLLPIAWTKLMEGKLPSQALLSDRYGNAWHVKLSNDQEKFYFDEGWTTFIEQNYVERGDFFIFKFDGIQVFDVKMFGSDSCNKRGVGSLMYKIVEKNEEEEEKANDNKDASYKVKEEGNEGRSNNCDPEDIHNDVSSNRQSCPHNVSRNVSDGEGVKATDYFWKKNKLLDPFGYEIFNSGKAPKPENPHFVTQINPKRPHTLAVPLEIVKTYRLELPSETFLRDHEGRQWKTHLTVWKDNRPWYYHGWKELCQANDVLPDEPCICEFIKSEEKILYIQVHIVRGHLGKNE